MRLFAKISLAVIVTMFVNSDVYAASFLELVGKISLANVKGTIDHMAIDTKNKRLFICAFGNNTVEVIDINSGSLVHTIRGLIEPHGILFVADNNKLYVTYGRNGQCDIYNACQFNKIGEVNFSFNADNIRYYPPAVYIGFGNGSIGVIDSNTDKQTGEIKLAGHPEGFEIDPDSNRIFVNIPQARRIAVVDLAKLKVETAWLIKDADNFPMTLDSENHRLFVCSRNPPKLLIFDINAGIEIQGIPIDSDADDIFYLAKNKNIYISCGNGFINVLGKSATAGYMVKERIHTAAGAGTSLLSAETGYFYLAVPSYFTQPAEIWIYRITD